MSTSWLVTGGIAGVCLIVGFAVVLLEATYDAGFEEGFAQGRAGKERRGGRNV